MFFWECGMETGISVNDPMCGEECSLRKGELCLLYIELFMLFFSFISHQSSTIKNFYTSVNYAIFNA
jgi:hypothetical protein